MTFRERLGTRPAMIALSCAALAGSTVFVLCREGALDEVICCALMPEEAHKTPPSSAGPAASEAHPAAPDRPPPSVPSAASEHPAASAASAAAASAAGPERLTCPPAHPPTSGLQAITQMFMVLVITLLWFSVYLRSKTADDVREGRWRPWFKLAAVLSAALFAYAMRSLYNPAVFAMALVAICVAAEHYGGLSHNETHLSETKQGLANLLGELSTSISTARGDLTSVLDELSSSVSTTKIDLSDLLAKQQADIKKQQSLLFTIMDGEGLLKYKQRIYDKYLRATRRIDAVIRALDIDKEWWSLDPAAPDLWAAYYASPGLTLYRALTTSAQDSQVRQDKVQFVVDMPVPTGFAKPGVSEWDARSFNKLLGLTWRLVVVHGVRMAKSRRPHQPQDGLGFPYVRVVIADCPSWLHAIDDDVFQILEHSQKIQASLVRELTAPLSAEDGTVDPRTSELHRQRKRSLSDWAHQDIRRYARRGCSGEEYVCSLFRFAVMREQLGEAYLLDGELLDRLLNLFGYQDWLKWCIATGVHEFSMPALDRKRAKQCCRAIFSQFFANIADPARSPGTATVRVSQLLGEIQ